MDFLNANEDPKYLKSDEEVKAHIQRENFGVLYFEQVEMHKLQNIDMTDSAKKKTDPHAYRKFVEKQASFYKIPPERVIVLCDDISFAPGRVRIRRSGSAGGHNGIKNIILHTGGQKFPRVRVGVGEKPADYDLADYVLGHFSKEDQKLMDEAFKEAGAAVVGTGRSDYPNQINNVLAFPGVFRGALDVRASDINDEMKVAAAYAIASLVSEEELNADYLMLLFY